MELLTTAEAAQRLSLGLGRTVRPRNVQDAARRGRIRAEKGAGSRGRYLIPEEEVERVLGGRTLSRDGKAEA